MSICTGALWDMSKRVYWSTERMIRATLGLEILNGVTEGELRGLATEY